MLRSLLLFALILPLGGCLRFYTNYPKDKLDSPPAPRYDAMRYRIRELPSVMDSGRRGLEEALHEHSPFRQVRQADAVPPTGVFVDAAVKWRQPGLFSLAFVWISAATYFIVPEWSTKERFTLVYDVYVDGQLKQTFSYEVGRKGFMWLPLAPAMLYTAGSANQAEVFEAVTYKFYDDAALLFAAPPAAPAVAAP